MISQENQSDFVLKTYIKWIDKKYINFFLENHIKLFKFLEKCLFNNIVSPFKRHKAWKDVNFNSINNNPII